MAENELTAFIEELINDISQLAKSPNDSEKLGGILAICTYSFGKCISKITYVSMILNLLDHLLEREESVVIVQLRQLSDYLQIGLDSTDTRIMELSARAIGRLSRGREIHIAELCSSQVEQALPVFQRDFGYVRVKLRAFIHPHQLRTPEALSYDGYSGSGTEFP